MTNENSKPLEGVWTQAAHLNVRRQMKTALPFLVPQAGSVGDAAPKAIQGVAAPISLAAMPVLILPPPHETKKKLGAVRFFQETSFLPDYRLLSVRVEVGVKMRIGGFASE